MAGSFLGGLAGGAIGSAVVRLVLDDSQYQAGMTDAKNTLFSSASTMDAKLSAFQNLAGQAFAAVGAAAVAFGASAVKAASAQNEALNKSRVVFGQASADVEAFADSSAEAFGISETAALSAAGGFGTMLQTAGLIPDAAAEMSVSLVALAGDLASFFDISTGDALEKLRSGLAGEAEPLRTLGVLLSEARVKQEAYTSGIAKVGAELTEAQKVQARFNVIMKDTRLAQGDAARTSDSLANQTRRLSAEFADFQADVGKELLPVVGDLIETLLELGRDVAPVVVVAFGQVADGLEEIIRLKNELGTGESWFPDFEAPGGGGQDWMPGWLSGVGDFVTQTLPEWVGNARDAGVKIEDALRQATGEGTAFDQLATDTQRASDGFSGYSAATAESADATERAAAAEDRLSEAMQRHIDKMYEAQSVQLELAGGVLGLIESAKTYAEAQREVRRLEEQGKEGTAAYREAVGELLSDRLQLEQQFIDFGTTLAEEGASIADAKTALKEYGKESDLSGAALRDFIRTGLAPVRQAVRELNDDLDKLNAKDVNITIGVHTISNMPDWWIERVI